MKQLRTGRVGQVAGKYGEHAPMATACCNACRTCVTSNVLSLGLAAVTFATMPMARAAKRVLGRA